MQQKKKICKTCQKEDYLFSGGNCRRCASVKYAKPKQATQKSKEKRTLDRVGFSDFFIEHIQLIKDEGMKCENCQQPLRGNVSEVAHILSKSKHLEVSTNEANVLYLCGMFTDNGCHAEFDNSLSRRREMPVFLLAAERYKLIQHLVEKESAESRQFDEYLLGSK